MADWSRNHRACTTTWTTLIVLNQSRKTFAKSGAIKMRQLTFWNEASSTQMRELQAHTISAQMDNIFRLIRGAEYENGVTRAKATAAIVDTLTHGEKTMAELAEVNDTNYRFWGEEDDI